MLSSKTVITFGLTAAQNQIVANHLKALKCEFIKADSTAELITSDYFASIINRNRLHDAEVKALIRFYSEIDGNLTERIILAKNPDELSEASNAQIFLSFDDLETKLDTALQKAFRKAKDSENTINNISLAMAILSQIKKHPGITTADLAVKINRNDATVRRFVEALCVMGERIEYDAETKGWKLHAK